MIKLCIFDLDGTILNTIETIAYYGNYALENNGIEAISTDKYKYFVGTGIYNLIKNMLNFRNCNTEEKFSKVFKDYDTAYNNNTTHKTKPYTGIAELLDILKSQDIKIAIVSNKPDFATQAVIKEIFGKNYFDYVTGQREGIPIKPDPYSILEIISDAKVEKNQCIYVGDTGTDMKAGKNAGLFTVGVSWGFRDEKELSDSGADLIIKKPEELYEYIKNTVS